MKTFRKIYHDQSHIRPRSVIKNNLKYMAEPHGQNDDTSALVPASYTNDESVFKTYSIKYGFTKDTIVSTSEGPFHSGDLRDFNKRIKVINQAGCVLKSDGVRSGGVQDIFGLLTDSSYIKGASAHQVLRISDDYTSEMTALTDLRKGDLVVCQKGIFGSREPVYNDECLDVFEVQELGKHICNMSMDNIQKSGLYLSDKFNNKSGYFSINIYNILNKFDAFVYRVPKKILYAPKEYVAAYLRGYFDGGTRFHLNRITATAACRELASDIVYLLNLFEINAEITKTLSGFDVVISGRDDIDMFRQEVEFLKNTHDFSGASVKPVNSGVDYEKLRKEYNARVPEISQDVLGLPQDLAELMKQLEKYEESFRLLGLEHKFNTLKLLSHTGCRVTEVTEYAKYTGRDEVFGVINVDGNHTWCANGIVVSDIIHSDNPAGQM
ncbi:LAGLIDADG family homing endonuclease [Salmonella enterica]